MKIKHSLALLVLAVCAVLSGQDIILENYPEGTDFWVVIPYNMVKFKLGDALAHYQLALEIRDQTKNIVYSADTDLAVPKSDWLKDTALPYAFKKALKPGKYQVLLRLKNLSLGDKYDLKRTFIIGDNYTEIGQAYFIATKEGIEFIPPAAEKQAPAADSWSIRQKFTTAVDSIHVSVGDSIISYISPAKEIRADITTFLRNAPKAPVKISFYEHNIRYVMDPFLYDQWFSYNARYSFEEQIEQLRYIANQNEWNSLRKIPEELYPEVIEKFWSVHDPSPGTLRNETRESFYQRVVVADERYTIHKRLKGWKSDRGRIYIKYGEPDEIHSEVHPIDMYPYIVWIYYSRNLEFEFADTGGFGQYKLRNKDEEY
jgi:GWxTD domain-containing protein